MLNEIDFKVVYSSGEDEPSDFFHNALLNSSHFDFGLGFFHSSGFRALAFGFAFFIHKGGKMRMIINDELSNEDKEAIERGMNLSPDEILEKKLLETLDQILKALSSYEEHFFKCLSWLIATKKLDIIAIVPSSEKGGLAHQKFGIFTDETNNKLAFNGSANFSKSALVHNLETISCYPSWSGQSNDKLRVEYYDNLFDKLWNGKSSSARIVSIEKIKTKIREKFPVKDIKELIESEKQISKNREKIKLKTISSEKQIIHDYPEFNVQPREYQKEAYENWVKNNNRGIFAMATGTGKTLTSIYCVFQEYKKNNAYHVLIIVPTITLLYQWLGEIKKFHFNNIYLVFGNSNWKSDLTLLKNRLNHGIKENFVIISTYDSFNNAKAIKLVNELNESTSNSFILIADEAHNIGATLTQQSFRRININKRIALSATPKREYDLEGTKVIEELFSDKYPYCVNFSMERAINEGFLCKYYYYPSIVKLNSDEMLEYIRISLELAKYYNFNQDTQNSFVEILLQERKRIVHKAVNKLPELLRIINKIGEDNLKFSFIYAPEGVNDSDESILQKMQAEIRDNFPKIKMNTITYRKSIDDRKQILRGFEEGKIDAIFAMKILDEGVDIPRTEIGIFASSTGNPRQFIQRRGRLLRTHPNKEFASIYDMVVIPEFNSGGYDKEFFKIEKKMVASELKRVAYFASLSKNFLFTKTMFEEVADFYGLNIETIINELQS